MDPARLLAQPFALRVRRRLPSAPLSIPMPRLRVTLKLLMVVGISVLGVLASSGLVLLLQRQQLIDTTQVAMTHSSTVIAAGLEHAMLRNDPAMMSDLVHSMVNSTRGEQLRILNTEGVIQVSSNEGEVGECLGQGTTTCQVCHAGRAQPTGPTAIVTYQNSPVLFSVNPIRNSPPCQTCHGPESKVLGIVMIQMPLTDLDNQLTTALWRMGLAQLGTLGMLVALLVLALRRVVIRPVNELAKGIAEIRAGNLDYEVQSKSQDELGDLARAFNDMLKQVKSSHSQMLRRTLELTILNDLMIGMSENLDLQQILELALDAVVNQFGMQAGGIYLLDDATGRFTLRASCGMSEALCQEIERRRREPDGDLSLRTAQAGQEFFTANMASESRFQGLWDDLEKRSYVNIPLKARGAAAGTLGLVSHAGQELTDREVQVLKAVGHAVGTAVENASLLAETRRREQETRTLYRLMMKIASSLQMSTVLDAIAEGAREILGADIGAVGLLDDTSSCLVVRAYAGTRTDILRGLTIPVSEAFSAAALNPICLEEWDWGLPVPHIADLIAQEGIVSSMAAPMWCKGRQYGFVGVMTRQRRHFTKEDMQLFVRFVLQIMVAIENADLYKQVRYMATLEERDRIARELHDNLAQMLGYLNVKAAITQRLLSANQVAEAASSLLELEQVTNAAYTDVREAIFSLRTTESSGWDLVPTLREYLADYGKHYGIDAQLVIADETRCRLEAEVQVQANRIIQEALTNVRKHSGANRAWVCFERKDDWVRITIADDGHGFDPTDVSSERAQHLGLQIMRERAASVGGTLEIDSHADSGTRVVLQVPGLREPGESR
jgi:nitrate/nitrite-specific signal transduction histidine kinase